MRTVLLTCLGFVTLAACGSTQPSNPTTAAAASSTGGTGTGAAATGTGTSTGAGSSTGNTGGSGTGGSNTGVATSGTTSGPGVVPGTLWIGGAYALNPTSLSKSATNPAWDYTCPPIETLKSQAQGGAEAIDRQGNLWTQFLTPPKNNITVWNPSALKEQCSGHPALTFGITQSNNLGALAFDAANSLWASVPTANQILGYGANTLQATGDIGPAFQLNPSATKGISTIFNPAGLAFDTTGTLWVANYYSILAYHTATLGKTSTDGAGNPLVPPDLVLTNAAAANVEADGGLYGQFNYDYLAFDSAGDLWVTVENYTTTPATAQIIEFSAMELSKLSTNSQPAPIFTINQPSDQGSNFVGWSAIAFDSKGNLWVGAHLAAPNLYRYPPSALTGNGMPDIIITAQDDTTMSRFFSMAFDPYALPVP